MENTRKRATFNLKNLLVPLLPCLFFFIQYLVVPVTGDVQVTPFTPRENITIDCGSSTGGLSPDGRAWIGDVDGKFSPIEQNKSSAVSVESQPPSSVDIPYSTARISYSEFTYSIPLTAAGPFTLVRNFNAFLHIRGEPTLVNEFSVNVYESQRLDLTFTPSPNISDSYAFINGIEVVSMPTGLYYGAANDDGVTFLGQAQAADTALEMMYRVNVGGKELSPGEDTGMFRDWLSDEDYLTIAKPSALPVNTSFNLNFSTVPSFYAPREVYITARTMGTNKTENEKYNLTWEFPVDSGFHYFVRLHFCEFQNEITQQGDRVFKIFLANLTAETHADVIAWSGGHGIPVYKDYVVKIGTNQNQQNLSVALHPSPAETTRDSDVILNGLEIFKLRQNFVLAGPNPDPGQGNSPPTSAKPDKSTSKIIVVVVATISGIVTVSLLLVLVFRNCSHKFSHNSIPAPPSDICRRFSLREIKTATNNFDKKFIIGRGGFGDVYRGFTKACSTALAIKRLNPSSQQGMLEFRTEIEMLSKLRHQNLVSLIGYCEDNKEMILVYDYMVHGTLRDHLYNTDNPPLQWEQRLKMCIGAAHGLNYLHRGTNHTIIHRDVKTTNILLNEKWVAKVSDFGLSKTNDLSNTHISTAVKGSFGYLDPEYYRLQKLTEKSDVYSFGVVLCEVLCARVPIDRTAEDQKQTSLAEWAQHCYNNGSLDQIIDPYLQGKIRLPSLLKFGEVAMSCLAWEGTKRPTMSEVVTGLELALHLQGSELNGNDENHANNSSNIDYHVLYTSGSGSMRVGR
ncbi:hypothetical protein V6N12_016641 [Hibiscus sabdariffa]|uniref:Protein kinase domain-containing protein n=1 Tax=Hibiscus sabdariffa TaxID=183260 RepID=A0ABR2CE96_9ROSI